MGQEVKTAQLGMNHSTARARLVKLIMFDMMKRLGEDKCFKCGIAIEDIDHMSIEHKIPWLYNNPDLFWDLDNIAFSHLACNKSDRPWLTANALRGRARPEQSKPVINGNAWCGRCQKYKPTSEFHANRANPYGFHTQCRECRSEVRGG